MNDGDHTDHDRGAKYIPEHVFGPSTTDFEPWAADFEPWAADFEPWAADFERVIRDGGVVLFPSDTVYGLACDPDNAEAIAKLYALKGRPDDKSAAVMFFDLHAGLHAFRGFGEKTHAALHNLMPGPVTALLPNSAQRFPLACRADPQTVGLRIVEIPQLHGVKLPVLQSSANRSGHADARRLEDVDPRIRAGVELTIDGGELPGKPSTVIDLRFYEGSGAWSMVRLGAVDEPTLAAALNEDWGFDPATYAETVRAEIPAYEEFQRRVVLAAAAQWNDGGRVLELGTGTGETARRLLEGLPGAALVCVDESAGMLAAAATNLPSERVELVRARLQEQLPAGPFELVVSSLAIHHLDAHEKPELFRRIHAALVPGGRFVLADVVTPDDPAQAVIPLTPGYDKPSAASEQAEWLRHAGFGSAELIWSHQDLAIVVAQSAG